MLRKVAVGLLALFVAGCAVGPEPLRPGIDECAQCRMIVEDPRYAAQLVTSTGRTYTFDAIECMAAFLEAGTVAEDAIHSLWVAAHDAPEQWLRVEDAVFVGSPALRTPMSAGIAATADRAGAERLIAQLGEGRLLNWASARAAGAAHTHGGGQPHAH
jgi:copper chaperone NosL